MNTPFITLIYRLSLLISVALLFNSCVNKNNQTEIQEFNNSIWNRFDIQEFDIQVDNAHKPYDIYVLFSHSDAYPNTYIDMNISLIMPDGGIRSRDYLFDLKDKDGNWLSVQKKDRFEIELPVIKGILFSEKGMYRLRIENKLTKFNTPGVFHIGYVVKESPKL
jgi:gliding motility-associated lipoprotein GldH